MRLSAPPIATPFVTPPRILALALIVASAVGGAVTRGAAAESRQAIQVGIDEILDVSGVRRQLGPLLARMRQQFEPGGAELSASERAEVSRIVGEAFRRDAVEPIVRSRFSLAFDEAKAREATVWFRSRPGQTIVAQETAAIEAQAPEVAEYLGRLRQAPPAPERVRLLQRLDAATGSTRMAMEIIMLVARSVAEAVNGTLPPERRARPDQLEQQLARVRAQAAEPARATNFSMLLFAYRATSDADLERYVTFAETESGRWFATAAHQALLEGIRVAADRAATELVRAVPPGRKGSPTPPGPGRP